METSEAIGFRSKYDKTGFLRDFEVTVNAFLAFMKDVTCAGVAAGMKLQGINLIKARSKEDKLIS